MVLAMWLCLIMADQPTYSKVIIINNDGTNTTECCVNGTCPCNSLHLALQNLTSNAIINITSESVTLHTTTPIGSGNLHNITITGNGATIMCNNSGGVYCESCSDVIIKGITWDQCGDPNKDNVVAGINFTDVHNFKIENCYLQGFKICPISLNPGSSDIVVKNTTFQFNVMKKLSNDFDGSGLKIIPTSNTSIVISDSTFANNGYFDILQNQSYYSLFVKSADDTLLYYSIAIYRTKFLSNSGGAYVYINAASLAPIVLSDLIFHNNTNQGIWFPSLDAVHTDVSLMLSNSSFTNNRDGGIICTVLSQEQHHLVNITLQYSNFTNNSALADTNNVVGFHIATMDSSTYILSIRHCNFLDNVNGTVSIFTTESRMSYNLVFIDDVLVMGSHTMGSPTGSGAVSIILSGLMNNTIRITDTEFISNNYTGIAGGALYVATANTENDVYLTNCLFQENVATGEGAAFYLLDANTGSSGTLYETRITIYGGSNFINNTGGNSIVYISAGSIFTTLFISATNFVSNTGTTLHLISSNVTINSDVRFNRNSANNGGAMYLEQGTQINFDNKYTNISTYFLNNLAAQYGGAIYIDLGSSCSKHGVLFFSNSPNMRLLHVNFTNNSAGVIGNSMYFNVHQHCQIVPDSKSNNSILYLPYQFKYDESKSTAIVSSPHSLMLYFNNAQVLANTYYIQGQVLGHPILFGGHVFDYFNNSAAPTQFDVQCYDNCTDIELVDNRVLVDNVSTLSLTLTGEKVVTDRRNVSLRLTSILETFNEKISVSVVVELIPCTPGYYYNKSCNCCVCYHHQDIVECFSDYNEIKKGYWFGVVEHNTTVSLCPKRYCNFGNSRKETRQGYCMIPEKLDYQCRPHRTGVACGECSSGHTLPYDSPDCINRHHCLPVMTVLVVVLTVLYWIAIVVAVFALMFHKYQVSLGYLYGIIYYYSIVDVVLDNNPYIGSEVFQLVAVLSSFAKLTPQLFGELCFVKGLTRIDQQFIHYSHAVAISLFLVIIIYVARYYPRIAYYVSHCIIRVMCLLLLLAYTSLASTSLQLLKPLTFAGVDEVYVYLSPSHKYFRDRHAFYGIVAALCGLIVVIGMPLLLLLQPFINSRVNFIKIMPLLDQYQSCYKDKYRYFASYYLICRLVMILIVFIGDSNYYNMLYYLQTACVLIAMIHIWIQPYKDNFLNALDGVILLTLVLVVNVNTFAFLSSATPEIISILVVFPLLLFCITGIKKLIIYCRSRSRQLDYDYDQLQGYEDDQNDQKERNGDMTYER